MSAVCMGAPFLVRKWNQCGAKYVIQARLIKRTGNATSVEHRCTVTVHANESSDAMACRQCDIGTPF